MNDIGKKKTHPLNGLRIMHRLEEIGRHLRVTGPVLDRPVMGLAAGLDDVLRELSDGIQVLRIGRESEDVRYVQNRRREVQKNGRGTTYLAVCIVSISDRLDLSGERVQKRDDILLQDDVEVELNVTDAWTI